MQHHLSEQFKSKVGDYNPLALLSSSSIKLELLFSPRHQHRTLHGEPSRGISFFLLLFAFLKAILQLVPPAELEGLLVSHPFIADAAVIPQKDEAAGEVPVAFIVRANDAELTEDDVKEFIAEQVVFYKRLYRVHFVHSIPKSPTGKILRKELRARLANATA